MDFFPTSPETRQKLQDNTYLQRLFYHARFKYSWLTEATAIEDDPLIFYKNSPCVKQAIHYFDWKRRNPMQQNLSTEQLAEYEKLKSPLVECVQQNEALFKERAKEVDRIVDRLSKPITKK
jgi:hypothetical protein